jgi:metal-dependent amidase/aminoacylase/carboxypeptidase family protein
MRSASPENPTVLEHRRAAAGASEDFPFYAKEVPGLFVFLGVTSPDQDPAKAAPNHSPRFFVDERALVVGLEPWLPWP